MQWLNTLVVTEPTHFPHPSFLANGRLLLLWQMRTLGAMSAWMIIRKSVMGCRTPIGSKTHLGQGETFHKSNGTNVPTNRVEWNYLVASPEKNHQIIFI
jgi:hypothetical protein